MLYIHVLFHNKHFYLSRARVVDDWNWETIIEIFDQLFEPGRKVAMQVNQGIYSYFKVHQNKSEMPKTLANRLLLDLRVLVVPLNNKLFQVFDKKFQQFIESDLLGFYTREVDLMIGLSKVHEIEKDSFKVLTLTELEAGFVVCLVPLAFSVVVFVFEWIVTLTYACFLYVVQKKLFTIISR